jgi:hypothetical protein
LAHRMVNADLRRFWPGCQPRIIEVALKTC